MPKAMLDYPNKFTFDQSSAWDLLCLSEAVENATLAANEKKYPFINGWRENNGSMALRDYLISISYIPSELWEQFNTDDQMTYIFNCYDFEFIPWFIGILEENRLFGEEIAKEQFAPFLEKELLERKHLRGLTERVNKAKIALKPYVNDDDWHTAIVDLIADIKIYADRSKFDFKSALKSAKRHAKADQDMTDRETLEGLAN